MSDNDDDKPKKGNGKKKNPWGSYSQDDNKVESIWGSQGGSRGSGHGGGGHDPHDLDEFLRRAQESFGSVMSGGGSGGTPAGKFIVIGLLAIVLIWLGSGFYIVNPGEQAVIQRFGAWSRTQSDPGLGYHFPAPIETSAIVNVQEIRRMNIGYTEVSSRGSSARRDVPEESLVLTSDRNIVDLDIVIQWNIKSAEDFLFEIYDQENTIKKVAESALREVVGQTNMFPVITTQRDVVANKAKEIIQTNLDEYSSGVNITQVLIERAEVHPDVQNAFQDVQSAKQDAEDVQNRADEYRNKIIPEARGKAIQILQEAEGYKESVIARSKGDADRFNSVYDAYLSGKDVTKERMYIETMENVLQNAQKIILDDKGGSGVVPYLPLDEMKKRSGTQ